MPKVLLLQFDTDPDCLARREILEKIGFTFGVAEPRWPTFFDAVNREQPDLIVIVAKILPSHALEAARYLGDGFNTRNIPVLLVDVNPKDEMRARSSAPRARIVAREELAQAVQQTLQPKVSS